MTTKQAEEIILKYKAGTATKEEKAKLETWYVRFKDLSGDVPTAQLLSDQQESWMLLEKEYLDSRLEKEYADGKKTRLWPRIAAAAAAIAIVTLGTWLYRNEVASPGKNPGQALAYTNDIAPGRNTATLTLANGEVINLDTSRASVVVTDSVRVATMLTASTPRGGQYQVVLSDGTKVWLNAESKLEFPSNFENKKQRMVKLSGEGYFEVAKDKTKPFIVESAEGNGRRGQIVEVLGTHFNINAYQDESVVKTTLLEGSVEVSSPDAQSGMRYRLKPGQQSLFHSWENGAAQLQTLEVDPAEAVAWKNNQFMFQDEKIENVMKMIARWYNVDVAYEGKVPEDRFGGMVSRMDSVSKVLQILESTGRVHFRIEGRRIVVRQ